jgi:hypothetical protein
MARGEYHISCVPLVNLPDNALLAFAALGFLLGEIALA